MAIQIRINPLMYGPESESAICNMEGYGLRIWMFICLAILYFDEWQSSRNTYFYRQNYFRVKNIARIRNPQSVYQQTIQRSAFLERARIQIHPKIWRIAIPSKILQIGVI